MPIRGSKLCPNPHIVETIYGENGKILGYVADNYVENDPAKVQEHLDNIARIWAYEEAKMAAAKMAEKSGK